MGSRGRIAMQSDMQLSLNNRDRRRLNYGSYTPKPPEKKWYNALKDGRREQQPKNSDWLCLCISRNRSCGVCCG